MRLYTALRKIIFLSMLVPIGAWALTPAVNVDEDHILQYYNYKNRLIACYVNETETRNVGILRSTLEDQSVKLTPITVEGLIQRIGQLRIQFLANDNPTLKTRIKRLRKRLKALRPIVAVCNEISADPAPTSTPTPSPTPSPSASLAPGTNTSVAMCADGIDNDADGAADDLDDQCQKFPYIEYNPSQHTNGEIINGWSVFQPSLDSRVIYVSSSTGDDSNDGLSSTSAKRTIANAVSLMRNGFPDWLLLKRGDTFGRIVDAWKSGGRSSSEPAVLSSYGSFTDSRPLIQSAGTEGFRITGGGGAPTNMGYVVLADLSFSALPRDTVTQNPPGIRVQKAAFDYFHIEGCEIGDYATGVVMQYTGDEITNSIVRRNVIRDSRSGDGTHAQGIYTDEVRNILIAENVIDRNGGTAGDPLADDADIFKHNMYIQGDGREVTVKDNIVARASSHGVQLRPGGTLTGNLVFDNPINVLIGGASGEFTSVSKNVLLDPSPYIIPSLVRGDNLHLQNLNGAEIVDNIILHSVPTTSGGMLDLTVGNEGYPLRNVSVRSNLFYGGGRMLDVADFAAIPFENISFIGNHFQQVILNPLKAIVRVVNPAQLSEIGGMNNRYFSVATANQWSELGSNIGPLTSYLSAIGDVSSTALQITYPEPRDVTKYAQSLGLSSSVDFLMRARSQSKATWDDAYTAQAAVSYIREGFGLTP